MENENQTVNAELEMETNWEQTIDTFDELGLKKDLLRGKK